jgi:hypothetical protein
MTQSVHLYAIVNTLEKYSFTHGIHNQNRVSQIESGETSHNQSYSIAIAYESPHDVSYHLPA